MTTIGSITGTKKATRNNVPRFGRRQQPGQRHPDEHLEDDRQADVDGGVGERRPEDRVLDGAPVVEQADGLERARPSQRKKLYPAVSPIGTTTMPANTSRAGRSAGTEWTAVELASPAAGPAPRAGRQQMRRRRRRRTARRGPRLRRRSQRAGDAQVIAGVGRGDHRRRPVEVGEEAGEARRCPRAPSPLGHRRAAGLDHLGGELGDENSVRKSIAASGCSDSALTT